MIVVFLLVVLLAVVIVAEVFNQPKKRRLMKSRRLQRKFRAIFKPWTNREVKKDLKRQGFKAKNLGVLKRRTEALDADES